jgi:hypothetical protein
MMTAPARVSTVETRTALELCKFGLTQTHSLLRSTIVQPKRQRFLKWTSSDVSPRKPDTFVFGDRLWNAHIYCDEEKTIQPVKLTTEGICCGVCGYRQVQLQGERAHCADHGGEFSEIKFDWFVRDRPEELDNEYIDGDLVCGYCCMILAGVYKPKLNA